MDKSLLKELEIDIREAISKYRKKIQDTDKNDVERIEFYELMISKNKEVIEELKELSNKNDKMDVKKFYNERRNENVDKKCSNKSKKCHKNY